MSKKKFVIFAVVVLVFSGMAYAAIEAKGKVVSVEGKKIVIQLDKAADLKAGDKVKVEALGGKKPGFSLQGC